MVRIVAVLACALALVGCASVAPMKPEAATVVKNGTTAVVFYDGVEQINYIEDKYFVLGVAQVASNSVYQGLWDSNRMLTALHAEELGKIGINARSVYDLYADGERTEADALFKEMNASLQPMKTKKGEKSVVPQVPARLREQLLAKGCDHLMWISWNGYTLHMQTLGLPALSKISTRYRVVDLRNDTAPLWDGWVLTWEETKVEGDTGKAFLEAHDLAGLKKEVDRVSRGRYLAQNSKGKKQVSVGQIIGIQPAHN
jgi:hypothetical protein